MKVVEYKAFKFQSSTGEVFDNIDQACMEDLRHRTGDLFMYMNHGSRSDMIEAIWQNRDLLLDALQDINSQYWEIKG